jgi:hypothetical protein
LGIKKKRGKMYRDLGNKNDGKIFKTLRNVKTFVAAFAVCFMNIWAISKPGMLLWLL